MKRIDASCPYCGAPVMMDKKGVGYCEYCGQYVMWDTGSGQIDLQDAYRAGYEFERGRRQAQIDAENAANRERQEQADAYTARRIRSLWILGWIFMPIVPLMILIIRNKTLPAWAKVLIIAGIWTTYFFILFVIRNYGS